ncbi:glycosyltransferase [Aestuariivivens marinum]|uniref:glycosyltransferase n=1 Tax=Aestuariivivens marinum TaxID=2913555 RepID=UPI001F595823|nr:glycosyltransferase [Aestuariivivens marinum]
MKVLFWLNKFPTFSETFIRDQIIALIIQGIDVLIYTNYKGINQEEIKALHGYEAYKLQKKHIDIDASTPKNKFFRVMLFIWILGIKGFRHEYGKCYRRSLDFSSFKKMKRSLNTFFRVHYLIKHRIDIIHAHYGTNGNEAAIFKKVGLPLRLYSTFHGYDIRLGVKKGGAIYADLFEFGDGIFAISDFNYSRLLSFGALKERLFKLSNGIDTAFYKREKAISKAGVINILTVARLVEEKALHIAIHAICKLIATRANLDLNYMIIGEGVERLKLEDLIEKLGLGHIVKLLGAKDSAYVAKLMATSDLFLLPSKAEALPTVLLEAQASGMVVLATNVGGVKEIVRGGTVVPPLNIDGFCKGLSMLIDGRMNWDEYSRLGREYVVANHDIYKQTKHLVNIYMGY